MAISPELLQAILAMDAYNRGDNLELRGLSVDTPRVGDAILLANFKPTDRALAAGFFASAYDLNGQTVISFRGTDFDPNKIDINLALDVAGGWITSFGITSLEHFPLITKIEGEVEGAERIGLC
jgi:hypothetical protein